MKELAVNTTFIRKGKQKFTRHCDCMPTWN